jgi:hypothetical protein
MSAALSEMTLGHIEERYKPLRHACEVLARITGASPNAARNWLRRVCAPQADSLGELARNDPEFRAKLIAWLEEGAP